MKQRTIERARMFEGVGLHSGKKCCMLVSPNRENTGIRINGEVITPNNSAYGGLCSVANGVATIEHLFGYLALNQITNIEIDMIEGTEFPILDGSASEYFSELRVEEQQEDVNNFFDFSTPEFFKAKGNRSIVIQNKDGPLKFESVNEVHNLFDDKNIFITIEFSQKDKYFLKGTFELNQETLEKIFKAKTFCFEVDIPKLRSAGLIKGGSTDNAIVISNENDLYEHSESILLHKILDFFGDSLTCGKIFSSFINMELINTGHKTNLIFFKNMYRKKR